MNSLKLRLLQVICHVGSIMPFFYDIKINWLIVTISYLIFQVIGIGIGMHRLFSHNSFKTSPLNEFIIGLTSTLCLVGSPISWAGIHRYHHNNTDTEQDPHSPFFKSTFNILTSLWYRDVNISRSLIKDLVKNKNLKFFHKYYFRIILIFLLLILVINWQFMFSIYFIPIVILFHSINIGLILNHVYGYRNFSTPDKSTNNFFVSLYTLGEGWHNNHHKYPKSWSNSIKWWEFDFPAILIKYVFTKK